MVHLSLRSGRLHDHQEGRSMNLSEILGEDVSGSAVCVSLDYFDGKKIVKTIHYTTARFLTSSEEEKIEEAHGEKYYLSQEIGRPEGEAVGDLVKEYLDDEIQELRDEEEKLALIVEDKENMWGGLYEASLSRVRGKLKALERLGGFFRKRKCPEKT